VSGRGLGSCLALACATIVSHAGAADPLVIATDPSAPSDGAPAEGASVAAEEPEPEPDYHPRRRGHFPSGWFLPVGLTLAGSAHPSAPTSFAFGAEVSAVAFPVGEGNWVGGYADVVHETKNELTRASLGLEMGYTFVGVDGGVALQTSAAGTHWGGVVRPMLTTGFITFYGRWGWFAGEGERFREIGVLLKFPIHLAEADWNEPPPPPPAPRPGAVPAEGP
jgi:hypothetical protein